MDFLQRQRTRSYKNNNNNTPNREKQLPDLPIGVENIPPTQTIRSTKSTQQQPHGLLKRVGSIFTPRKRPNLDLQLTYSTLHHNRTRQSFDDFDSPTSPREYDPEIRCPSGLGSAASIISKRSLPPSPFYPQNGSPYTPVAVVQGTGVVGGAVVGGGSYPQHVVKRAISSPNLLRSLGQKVRGKTVRPRGGSIVKPGTTTTTTTTSIPSAFNSGRTTALSFNAAASSMLAVNKPALPRFPDEVLSLIMFSLPLSAVASCAIVSQMFLGPARSSLYGTIDTSPLTDAQLEMLISTLSTRHHLAELVMTFVCPEWPDFFLSDGTSSSNGHSSSITSSPQRRWPQHKDSLLMATFGLAIERMSNLTSLTLPSFDTFLIRHQTSFGLKSVTFLSYTMSDSETKAVFAWLDGQVNISTLRFPNLTDLNNPSPTRRTNNSSPYTMDDRSDRSTESESHYLKPQYATYSRATSLSPYSTPSKSTRPGISISPTSISLSPTKNSTDDSTCSSSSSAALFSSPTLLPNLTTLHATPNLTISLTAPLAIHASPTFPPTSKWQRRKRRPLQSVSLNINSTLYTGLRPASLMHSLSGITHLGLSFGPNVDRRTFEKVIGATGASLGSVNIKENENEENDDPFVIVDPQPSPSKTGLKTLEIIFQVPATQPGRDETLYKSLQASLPRYATLTSLRFTNSPTPPITPQNFLFLLEQLHNQHQQPSSPVSEHDMIDTWVKLCPTLTSITLFSGMQWSPDQKWPF